MTFLLYASHHLRFVYLQVSATKNPGRLYLHPNNPFVLQLPICIFTGVCTAIIRAQHLLKATADGTHRSAGSPSAYSGVENIFTVCQRRIRITGALKVSAVTSRALHLAALNGGAGGRERRGGGT